MIAKLIGRQPAAIRDFHGPFITNTLKLRRSYFRDEMLQYYRFLEKEVDVVGSDKREFFKVIRNNDGSVHVTVTKITKEGRLSDELYNRVFLHGSTDEIRLWALAGADSIDITGTPDRSIKIRLIGGAGEDTYFIISYRVLCNCIYRMRVQNI
ncbi:MAG: hypothetical protein EON56_05225 [Alphaproteobacteria bacterium]|nr:MAG: hypothetical protein EON56_05225 [Alphaproteobacteria bacterium]